MATEKWADLLISAVRYNSEHGHIEYVVVQPDKTTYVGDPPVIESRATVVAKITAGMSYCTIIATKEGKWKRGANVIIVRIKGIDYIKTVDNKTESDNLENLREF